MYEVGDDGGFRYTKIGLQCFRDCFEVAGINISKIESKEPNAEGVFTRLRENTPSKSCGF